MITEQNVRSLASDSKREKGNKRSKSAIILNILSVCTKGASKTKIVYRANLNFKTATPYIELLSQNGLLHARGDSGRLYETTPHGVEVMKTLRQLGNDLL
jgi:predicted transcriptional regulator